MAEHYAVLGVPVTASTEQVRSAYRRLALLHHPDHGGSVEAFHRIQQAHHVLADAGRRAGYDEQLSANRVRLQAQRRNESVARERSRREAASDRATTREFTAVPQGWGMDARLVTQRARPVAAPRTQRVPRPVPTTRLDQVLELVISMLWGVTAAMLLILLLALCASLFLD